MFSQYKESRIIKTENRPKINGVVTIFLESVTLSGSGSGIHFFYQTYRVITYY